MPTAVPPNGDPNPHDKGVAGKVVPYEDSVRVPWIMRVPGQTIRGTNDLPVSSIDLPVTFANGVVTVPHEEIELLKKLTVEEPFTASTWTVYVADAPAATVCVNCVVEIENAGLAETWR